MCQNDIFYKTSAVDGLRSSIVFSQKATFCGLTFCFISPFAYCKSHFTFFFKKKKICLVLSVEKKKKKLILFSFNLLSVIFQ